jgi:competence protein ComGF
MYEEISIIDAILSKKVNGRTLEPLIYNLTTYLETIEELCEVAECTNTLPKEETFEVEY